MLKRTAAAACAALVLALGGTGAALAANGADDAPGRAHDPAPGGAPMSPARAGAWPRGPGQRTGHWDFRRGSWVAGTRRDPLQGRLLPRLGRPGGP